MTEKQREYWFPKLLNAEVRDELQVSFLRLVELVQAVKEARSTLRFILDFRDEIYPVISAKDRKILERVFEWLEIYEKLLVLCCLIVVRELSDKYGEAEV